MGLDLAQERELAHSLLDRLTEEGLSSIRGLLENMVGQPSRSREGAYAEWRNDQVEDTAAPGQVFGSVILGEGVTREEILCEFGI